METRRDMRSTAQCSKFYYYSPPSYTKILLFYVTTLYIHICQPLIFSLSFIFFFRISLYLRTELIYNLKCFYSKSFSFSLVPNTYWHTYICFNLFNFSYLLNHLHFYNVMRHSNVKFSTY